jgi:ATP synthase protein I
MADEDQQPNKPSGALGDLVQVETMVQLALVLPIGCALGWFVGAALDKHFHTSWMGVVGILLGAAGGFIQIFRTASGYLKRDK